MRNLCLFGTLAFVLACGGGSTTPAPDRFNFAIVGGKDQQVPASAAAPERTVTAMLTRDPQGKFASRLLDFLSPAIAYAQDIVLSGEPVANQIVCGQQAKPGEPEIVPLCAFTLADGKAANHVRGGSKAGTYVLPFTAQVATQAPVKDSTTFTVLPGAPAEAVLLDAPNGRTLAVGGTLDLRPLVVFVRDQFGNDVDWSKLTPDVALRDGSEPAQPSPDFSSWTITWDQQWSGRRVYVYVWFGSARTSFPLDYK